MSRQDLPILEIRRRLGVGQWGVPYELGAAGVDGDSWVVDHKKAPLRVIVSHGPYPHLGDAEPWVHASISHRHRDPSYEELVSLHRAVWGDDGWAYQVFAPAVAHVNIHPHALHLWGRPDGRALLPNFGSLGTI